MEVEGDELSPRKGGRTTYAKRRGDNSSGAHLPPVDQDAAALSLAERYAPRIFLDQREPFLPVAVGYVIFTSDGYSPSVPRCIGLTPIGRRPAEFAIEYEIWWDWDIGHLYELEHVWVYVGSDEVVGVEASWHGGYFPWEPGKEVALEGDHPVLYAEPGKHAFFPQAAWFGETRELVLKFCGPRAGTGGLMVSPLFERALAPYKTAEADALIAEYLKRQAFEPSFVFDRPFTITRDILLPWPNLRDWIPKRVEWCLEQLRLHRGK